MKILALLLVSCFSASAQFTVWRQPLYEPRPQNPAEVAAQKEAEYKAALAQRLYYFIPRDPWRIIQYDKQVNYTNVTLFTTNYAKGEYWEQFSGTIVEIVPGAVIIDGWHGHIADFAHGMTNHFKVLKFPYPMKIGDVLYQNQNFTGHINGEYDYSRIIDYGSVTFTPGSSASIAAAANAALARASADLDVAAAKILSGEQQLAEQGIPYAQYRMGMRYLTGDGVPKSMVMARALLSKSAFQGYKAAEEELARLSSTAAK